MHLYDGLLKDYTQVKEKPKARIDYLKTIVQYQSVVAKALLCQVSIKRYIYKLHIKF